MPYRPNQEHINVKALAAMIVDKMRTLQASLPESFKQQYQRREAGAHGLTLMLEPGRYPVAEAGYLAVQVNTVKPTPYNRTYIGVDSGFNHLVRPVMYGSYHHVTNVSAAARGGCQAVAAGTAAPVHAGGAGAAPTLAPFLIAGNICESGDVFTRDHSCDGMDNCPRIPSAPAAAGAPRDTDSARADDDDAAAATGVGLDHIGAAHNDNGYHGADGVQQQCSLHQEDEDENRPGARLLPCDTRPGDVLVIHTVGAYGYTMSSEYNSRPRPAEVLIKAPTPLVTPSAVTASASSTSELGCPIYDGNNDASSIVIQVIRRAKTVAQLVDEIV